MMDDPNDDGISLDNVPFANSDSGTSPDEIFDGTTVDRLNRLEIQASFTEDLVDRLELIITRQQNQIDQLTREVQRLRQTSSAESQPAPRNLRDELPPHY
jgi:SlyX protein